MRNSIISFPALNHSRSRKGQTIISEGDKVDCEYFVLDGILKTFFINDDMKMFILQFAMPTWWASDYNALYSGAKATVSVDCITNAEVLCLASADREQLCKEIHQVEHFFRWRTNRGYVAAHKRLLSLMNSDAKHRYEELMAQFPTLYNLVPLALDSSLPRRFKGNLSRLYNS